MQTKIVLDFLQQLKQNNETEWMHANKPAYQEAKTAFQGLVKSVLAEVSLFDDTIVGLEPKQCIFRINRDVRFTQNKKPYKGSFYDNQDKDKKTFTRKVKEKLKTTIFKNRQ